MNELIDKPQYLIIGAGLTGSVLAHKISSELNAKVLVIDKKDHIAGNCYDYIDKDTGILINKYGPRIFHTDNKDIWTYVNKYSTFKNIQYKVLNKIDNNFINTPINVNSINNLCDENIDDFDSLNSWLDSNQKKYDITNNSEEEALSIFGDTIYEKLIKPYLIKKYNTDPKNLNKLVLKEFELRKNQNDLYYKKKFVGIPTTGYTNFIRKLLSFKNIKYLLNIDFFKFKKKYNLEGIKIIYTGPIDTYFSNKGLDKLQYISFDFDIKHYLYYNKKYIQENSVINFIDKDISYIKSVEYKHFNSQRTPHTLTISQTITDNSYNPLLPIPSFKNLNLYEKYKKFASEEKNVYFTGMMAEYKYYSMAESIENAFELFNKEIKPNHTIVKNIKKTPVVKNFIIICRYDENLMWLNNIVNSKYIGKIIIFNKGSSINYLSNDKIIIKDSLNIGRETGTYLDYIIFNYHNLPENIWFIKANPFKSNPNFLELFKDDIIEKYINKSFQTLTTRYNENIPNNMLNIENNIFFISDKAKIVKYFIDKNNLQIKGHNYFAINDEKQIIDFFKEKYNEEPSIDFLCKYVGISPPSNNIVEYSCSSCFFLNSSRIKIYNIDIFKKLRKFLYESDSQGKFQNFLIKRFWGYLFSRFSYKNIQHCYEEFIKNKEFFVAFDPNNNKLKICNYNNDALKIDNNSVLLIKNNNKFFYLPKIGLKKYNNEIICKNINNAVIYYNFKKWKKPLAVIITGYIHNSFSNNLLREYIKNILKISKNIKIFIHTWEDRYSIFSVNKIDNNMKIDKTIIENYFGNEISNKIEKIFISKYKSIKFYGKYNGFFQNDNLICYKLMWAGKQKIIDYVFKNKWYFTVNLDFNIFNSKHSWKNGLNTNTAYEFTLNNLTENKNIITFFKNEIFYGMDNIYTGNSVNILKLTNKFNKELENIVKKFGTNTKKEELIYYMSNIINGLTPEDSNLKIEEKPVMTIRKINFNSPKSKPKIKYRKKSGMLF